MATYTTPKTDIDKATVGVAYIRVSDLAGREESDILSPDSAIEAARVYYQRHTIEFNENLSRQYQDINVSAYKEGTWKQRKGLSGLMASARRGEFQHIAFFSVSRLARNLTDGFAVVAEFKRLGVTCHFMTDPIPDSDNPAYEIVLASLLWAASTQSKSISTFTTAAIKEKQRRGIHHGILVTWLTKDEKGTITLEPYWSKIFRMIVDLSLAGLSCSDISKQMNSLGYKRVKGQAWTSKSIYDSIKPVYLEKMAGWDHLGKDRINEKLQRIFPQLITDQEHKRLMLMYHQRGESVPDNLRIALRSQLPRGTRMATGLIRCMRCGLTKFYKAGGSQIRGKRGRIHRYMCPQCGHTATGPMLEDALIRSLRQVLVEHRDLIAPDTEPKNDPLPGPQTTVANIDKQMSALLDLHLNGRVPSDLYDEKMAVLVSEKTNLEKIESQTTLPDLVNLIEDSETDQAWRVLALKAIKEASYPHTVQLRDRSRNLRDYDAIKITFVTGGTYLAPLYRDHYTGTRVLIKVEDEFSAFESNMVNPL